MLTRNCLMGLVWLLLTACGVADARGDTIFFDDFNDGNANGWVFPYTSGTI